VRLISALAIAALLLSACVVITYSRHSVSENPLELFSRQQDAELKVKEASTKQTLTRAHREDAATLALEKRTNQLRAQTESAVAFAKSQLALLQKDKADELASKERTNKLNTALKAELSNEAAAIARTNMLQKVATSARLQFAEMPQVSEKVSRVEAQARADTAATNLNARDAIQHALDAAKKFKQISLKLAPRHEGGATLAHDREATAALTTVQHTQPIQLGSKKHAKLADKAFIQGVSDDAKRAKDLWLKLFHKPVTAKASPVTPPSGPSIQGDGSVAVAVAANPVWSSPAQKGALDVAQAAVKALNSLSHGKVATEQDRISVLPPLTCYDVVVGSSANQKKRVHVAHKNLKCPESVSKKNWIGRDQHGDSFHVSQSASGDGIIVDRLDAKHGWGMNLIIRCCQSTELKKDDIASPIPSKSTTAPSKVSHEAASKAASSKVSQKSASKAASSKVSQKSASKAASSKVSQKSASKAASSKVSQKSASKAASSKVSQKSASKAASSKLKNEKTISPTLPHSATSPSIDDFALAGDLPAIRKEVHASLGDLNNDAVVKLSKRIESSLGEVEKSDIKGITQADVAAALAKAQAAAKDAAASQDIAEKARIAAAKSDALLYDANKAKVEAVAKEQAASKAAAAASAADNDLKAKLAKATSESQLMSKKADAAHALYLNAKKEAELMKAKAAETAKQSETATATSKAAQLKADSANASAKLAASALAESVKALAEKEKSYNQLKVDVEQARKARDAAAAAAAKALKEAEATKTLNSAKLASAHKAAAAAEADLKAKIAAAAVASRDLRVAGAVRLQKQKLAVAADAAFVEANGKFKLLQTTASKSKHAADSAQDESRKAAVSAKEALKVYLARQQSAITWPGKKPDMA
jgi:trimeric autotransporter adhesin